jgi:hypothetical protein
MPAQPPLPPLPPIPPTPPEAGAPADVRIVTDLPGGVTVTTGDGQTIVGTPPRTGAELALLRARRSELSRQLTSAQDRREELQEQLRGAQQGADRGGLEQRLQVLDQRIISLEQEIASTGRLLVAAPALAGSESRPFRPGRGDGFRFDPTPIAIIFLLFVLAPMAFAFARSIWKRGTRAATAPVATFDEARFQRLEQAVDAIAVEVERIGEGQRFVTQLLADGRRDRPAVGAGGEANRVA